MSARRRLTVVVSLALACMLGNARVTAAVPLVIDNIAPIIRLDTGGHSAEVYGFAAAPDGKTVATASNDQSLRIWSVPDLELLHTIRMPTGPDRQGLIFAIAYAPDGKTIAVSGRTGSWEDIDRGPWCIYLVDVASKDIARTICDLTSVPNRLAYSADGTFLAVAFKWGKGIRVYRAADGSLAGEDRNYADSSTWLEFDKDGRLVTTALGKDGKLRLYDKTFHLIASRAMPDGRKPLTASFSPDGTEIAVGYAEPEGDDPRWPARVDVLSGSDLSSLFQPDTRSVDNGTLWRLSWSADGKALFAGGTWRRGNRHPIRRWMDGGRGRPQDVASSPSTIYEMRKVSTDEVGFVGGLVSIGLIGANGRNKLREMPVADFYNIGDHLAISADGATVQFAYEASGEKPAWFSFLHPSIQMGEPPADIAMTHPQTDDPQLDIRDWSETYRPTLNGKPLVMQHHDLSYALAIVPDKARKSFLIGSSWYIYRYDSAGKELWRARVIAEVRGLVVTPDGRLAVAALSDGTLHWFAVDSGKELLALFPHKDGDRWVAWTPSGYYMATVGGDALVGWQVNRGREKAAVFYPVRAFSDKYYRPDIVLLTLASLDENRAIHLADAKSGRHDSSDSILGRLPPVLTILDPTDDAQIRDAEVTLRFRIRSLTGEPVETIAVRSNDNSVKHDFPAPALSASGEAEGSVTVVVPRKDSEISMFAKSRAGSSEIARVRLKWAGSANDPEAALKRVYVLAVGVSKYKDVSIRLKYPAKDAHDFVGALQRQVGKVFSEVVPNIIVDDNATVAHVRAGLKWLKEKTAQNDIGVVFLAGHGFDDDDGTYYYLPYEGDIDALTTTALPYSDLLDTLTGIAGQPMLFVDTCHAGHVLGYPNRKLDIERLVSEIGRPQNGVVVFAAARGKDDSIENDDWQNGVFTHTVVEGLDGAARYQQRHYITTSMLDLFVKETVRDRTNNKQWPVVTMPPDFSDIRLAISHN